MNHSTNIHGKTYRISREDRTRLTRQNPKVIWLTGLSGSGKSTLADLLEQELHKLGILTVLLDGDNIRQGLNNNVDFSLEGRKENIRRIGEVAKLFHDTSIVVITAFISPLREDRDFVRKLIGKDFVEVYVECPVEICESRDVKGLYQKARNGEIKDFTGISSPYEAPLKAEITVNTSVNNIEECIEQLMNYLVPAIKQENK